MDTPLYINIPQRQYNQLKGPIDKVVQETLESNRWLFGKYSEKFSQNFAEYCETKHCLLVANGTDALEIALQSIDFLPGDGCITVANAGGYTSSACYQVGLTPQYIDIDPTTLTMNTSLLSKAIQQNTKAIVATHLYGNVVDVLQIKKILKQLNREDIAIVEDCAEAHGALCHGKKVGSLGDIGTFSFYPTKNLGALGDGGAITTNSDKRLQKLKLLHQYGWEARYNNKIKYGRNSRLDEIQAAILYVKLPHLDEWTQRRRDIIAAYKKNAPASIHVMTDNSKNGACHLAILKAQNIQQRDLALTKMKQQNIIGDIHFPILDAEQNAWKDEAVLVSSLNESKAATETIFTLPCFPEITDEELQEICKTLRSL